MGVTFFRLWSYSFGWNLCLFVTQLTKNRRPLFWMGFGIITRSKLILSAHTSINTVVVFFLIFFCSFQVVSFCWRSRGGCWVICQRSSLDSMSSQCFGAGVWDIGRYDRDITWCRRRYDCKASDPPLSHAETVGDGDLYSEEFCGCAGGSAAVCFPEMDCRGACAGRRAETGVSESV